MLHNATHATALPTVVLVPIIYPNLLRPHSHILIRAIMCSEVVICIDNMSPCQTPPCVKRLVSPEAPQTIITQQPPNTKPQQSTKNKNKNKPQNTRIEPTEVRPTKEEMWVEHWSLCLGHFWVMEKVTYATFGLHLGTQYLSLFNLLHHVSIQCVRLFET